MYSSYPFIVYRNPLFLFIYGYEFSRMIGYTLYYYQPEINVTYSLEIPCYCVISLLHLRCTLSLPSNTHYQLYASDVFDPLYI